ncbi:MAG: hypothetical protein ACO1NW_14635 [Chitinophagaceae bacterium]
MKKFLQVRKIWWLYVWVLLMAGWMSYATYSGWRIFSSETKNQQWSSSGPGYHK